METRLQFIIIIIILRRKAIFPLAYYTHYVVRMLHTFSAKFCLASEFQSPNKAYD